MSATDDLKQDHVFIRRLQAVIEKCCTQLYEGKDVPLQDISKIAIVIEQFVDAFHHHKEEDSYFPETEHRDHYSEEIRKFVIEHEFGRRIAKRVRLHLEECRRGMDAKEPLARFLKTYSVFILDHTSKEDRFFAAVAESKSLSSAEEAELLEKFGCMKSAGQVRGLLEILEQLEQAGWAR